MAAITVMVLQGHMAAVHQDVADIVPDFSTMKRWTRVIIVGMRAIMIYDGYGGTNGGNYVGFYCAYGGYGYGYGFVNPLYGAGYGVGGYSVPGGSHGGPIIGYGGMNRFEIGAGGSKSIGYWSGDSKSRSKGRFHPYRRY
ncbi:hypothetical protein ACOSQ3_021369 [Xanthoceras sorbifolium]